MSACSNYPTWMNELRNGESPVLNASEWRLLVEVRSMAQKEFGVDSSSVDTDKKSEELSSLEEKLRELVRNLKMCEQKRRYFQDHYRQWRPVRDRNIRNLREIANTIQKKKKATNDDKFAGTFTSLVGGAVSFAVRRHPVVALVAGGVALLGSIAAFGSSCAEQELIEEKIKQVKATVKKDRQYFDVIWSWLADSSELQASVNQVRAEIIRNSNLWENATKAIVSLLSILSDRKDSNVDMEIKKMLNSIKISPKYTKEICDVVAIIMAFFMVEKRHGPSLKLASSGFRTKSQFLNFARGLLLAFDMCPKSVSIYSPKKSIAILGMILDFSNLLDISQEIDKGSPSEECEKVKKIANVLESEAFELEKMCDEIQENAGLYD